MSEAKKKKKKPVVAILLIVILLLAAGGGFLAYKVFFADKKTEVEYVKKELVEKTLPFEEFIINLADEGGRAFIKIKLTLAYPEDNKDLDKELTQKLDKVQDTINMALRQKKSQDFDGAKLEEVKKEVINKINDGLTSGRITNIYINSIVTSLG